MKGLVAFDSKTLKIVDIPIPEPDDYEVLVKNEGCVFCNSTDKMIVEDLFSTPNYPVLIGHESFGYVIKVGKKVKKYKLGDRVICSNAIVNGFDGKYYSSWGGFAEYGIAGDLDAYLNDFGKLDENNLYRARYSANVTISKNLPKEKACLAFPLAETASALKQVGSIKDKTVVIIGTGIVGYFFCYFAKQFGAKEVICFGRRENRLEIARKAGADKTFIDVNEATEYLLKKGGVDVVCECSGNYQVLENGIPYLKNEGILATYAVPHKPYVFDLLKTPTSFKYVRIDPAVHNVIDDVCKLLEKDKVPVNLFLTHQWNFNDAPDGYAEVRKGNVIKGLVNFD